MSDSNFMVHDTPARSEHSSPAESQPSAALLEGDEFAAPDTFSHGKPEAPWEPIGNLVRSRYRGPGTDSGVEVCTVPFWWTDPNGIAQLISASPDLLLACKRLADGDCMYDGSNIVIRCESHADAIECMRTARAAIAKATGQ